MKGVYQRKCKNCKVKFTPMRANQLVCGYECSISYSKTLKTKETRQKNKVLKEKIKTKSDWLKDAQKIFNKYIRLRDKDKPCISCGKQINGVRHASHYLSVGSSPSVRYNENNVWVSCYKCNVMLSGNQLEYRKRLLESIGEVELNKVELAASIPKHYSIEEIKQIIKQYNQKIKEIQ